MPGSPESPRRQGCTVCAAEAWGNRSDAQYRVAVIDPVRAVVRDDPTVAYALIFGSFATGAAGPRSDLDIAIGFREPPDTLALGDLIGRLETATGRTVDVVDLDQAPPALAWQIFHDGLEVHVADRDAFVDRKARAILDYCDWRPTEAIFTRAVLGEGDSER